MRKAEGKNSLQILIFNVWHLICSVTVTFTIEGYTDDGLMEISDFHENRKNHLKP